MGCCPQGWRVLRGVGEGGDAVWQELATPAAALRYITSEGAPSTLQQVQIERAAKNSKARNGFEFSFEAPTRLGTGEPRPPVIKQQGTTMGSKVRPWTGLQTPLPNGNGAAVHIGYAPATTKRSKLWLALPHRASRLGPVGPPRRTRCTCRLHCVFVVGVGHRPG